MLRRGPFKCAGTAFVDTDDAAISVAQEDENYIHFGLQVAEEEGEEANEEKDEVRLPLWLLVVNTLLPWPRSMPKH